MGANIGLTSLWFAQRYGCSVVAVEPSPDNARLTRLNLEQNQVRAQVIEAAVGPHDGKALFEDAVDSNLGHLNASGGGREVVVVSIETVLGKLPAGVEVDLVNIDIEGGEGQLLRENLGWLGRVRSIITEFHPTLIDYPAVIKTIEGQGFRYFPPPLRARLRVDGRVHSDELSISAGGFADIKRPAILRGLRQRPVTDGLRRARQLLQIRTVRGSETCLHEAVHDNDVAAARAELVDR